MNNYSHPVRLWLRLLSAAWLLLGLTGLLRGQIQSLGPAVNSPYKELLPRISPDGRSLYFVREGHPEAPSKTHQEVWLSVRDARGRWQPARRLPPPINGSTSSAVFGLTPDGNTLVLRNTAPDAPPDQPRLALATRTGPDEWATPQPQYFEPFIRKSTTSSFFLANDGRTLLLEFEGEDSNGMQDLYVSFLQDNGTWSRPLNLGSVVNTTEYEVAPFLASDLKTLYFASNGHPGLGSLDLFVTTRLDESWQNWSPPRNLGAPLNTPGMDAYFSLTAAGDTAYFCSSTPDGNVDIFKMALPTELRPRPVLLVSGTVRSSADGQPVAAAIRYTDLQTGQLLGVARTEPQTGRYQIALPAGSDYDLYARAPRHLGRHERLDLTREQRFRQVPLDLELVPLAPGNRLRLNNLFFDSGSNQLQEQSRSELAALYEVLVQHPQLRIELAGHTDSTGSAERNQKLSQQRAEHVRDWLIRQGIPPARLQARGYADTQPVAPNRTPEGRALNRRVECVVLAID